MAGSSRRRFLQTLGASLVVTGASSALPGDLWASDTSLSDRLDLLYGNQFNFDDHGRPRITVGLMQGKREVALSASGGLQALPSGDGGTAILGGGRWRIRVADSKPAQQRFRVVLDALPASELRRVSAESERWKGLGFDVAEREVGALFGVAGKVLDTRKVLLTTDLFSSEKEAEARARALGERFDLIPRLHPEVERRASGRMIAEDLETGVRIEAEGVLWFAPRRGETVTVHDVEDDRGRVYASRPYRGQIYVAIDRRGELAVVNLVGESDLLSGVVPSEIYASAPLEALKAQAVAARGHVLAKIGARHLDDPFLLCAHQHCQVYSGVASEHARTNDAVRGTIGRVLMRPNETQLVDTVYSANCGGHTEDNEHVWASPADPQLRGVADPQLGKDFRDGIDASNLSAWLSATPDSYSRPASERMAAAYRWTETIDPDSLVGNPDIPADFGKLMKIEVHARGRSGRATHASLHGSRRSVDLHGELRIRKALGGLRSSMFVVDGKDRHGRLVLRGGGYGHGVGMCQHGAIGMAAAGKSYGPILNHYYSGSKLIRLW
ncbi:SpoIID/LytB domain-containing protein [Pseudenhygromyxa sp. WMMC2535]|uniref:SpoIID/LytB domain-containing protein n=1 Tax=Pseudenhygromyxa sp. WMMC2535 TaxID=2712867 RepID=UPI00155409F2|nr:SpoIID/LytB domain-containing protein [Pseudenhygromyxa sp. WMMC2535]NVB36772.1 SpoIID/LytB domain-containing protein [Pseudenhygromyxa sp. WMMC2535]